MSPFNFQLDGDLSGLIKKVTIQLKVER